MTLTNETFQGPWAGLPVAWTDDDQFDEETYRADIASCCKAGVPGIYTCGTTGEFYAMEWDEFDRVTRAAIEECHAHEVPVMIGCTSTYTTGAVRRAQRAAELGADAIQVALPFWMEIGTAQIVPFFREVAAAAEGLALSIYETTRTKVTLTLDQHRAIKDAEPNYLMVKANKGTVGTTSDGCQALAQIVNVFVNESLWASLGPQGIRGSCSSMVYWNPQLTLDYWEQVAARNWDAVNRTHERIAPFYEFLHSEFRPKGFTDTAYDRLGGIASGFLKTSLRNRGPYPSATPNDVQVLRNWYLEHLPEMLSHSPNLE